MPGFYERELTKPEFLPVVWEHTAIYGFNTAIFEEIGGDEAKSLGLNGPCGCTVLVIASRSGVYMAHYFEDIAFAPSEKFLKKYGSAEACFEKPLWKV